jgi:hypothetical protein
MVLTVEQARKLLPPEYAKMSDAQVEEIVAQLEALADIVLDAYIEQHRKRAVDSKSLLESAA